MLVCSKIAQTLFVVPAICLMVVSCRTHGVPEKQPFNRMAWLNDPGSLSSDDSARRREIADVATHVLKRNQTMDQVENLLGKADATASGNPWRNDLGIAPPTPIFSLMYHICKSDKGENKSTGGLDFMVIGFNKDMKLIWIVRTIN